nr:hypothetical protein [Prosthecochloris sp. ZM]
MCSQINSGHPAILLDCTLRDGGYYNAWNFSPSLIQDYLSAMKGAQIDVVELGFRFLKNESFKDPCAFTTDPENRVDLWQQVPESARNPLKSHCLH